MGVRISIFAESVKRLYKDGKVNEKKVIELFNGSKISKEEKDYILGVD